MTGNGAETRVTRNGFNSGLSAQCRLKDQVRLRGSKDNFREALAPEKYIANKECTHLLQRKLQARVSDVKSILVLNVLLYQHPHEHA